MVMWQAGVESQAATEEYQVGDVPGIPRFGRERLVTWDDRYVRSVVQISDVTWVII